MKALIAYYSQSGQTKKYARLLADRLGADLYEIRPVREYDSDMWRAWDEAQIERQKNEYPALKGKMPDLSGYDTILIGGASWGYTLANPVTSFVRKMDFTGKRVSAFWTFYDHDEKWNADCKNEIETRGGTYVNGLPLPRSLTSNGERTAKAIDAWINTLK